MAVTVRRKAWLLKWPFQAQAEVDPVESSVNQIISRKLTLILEYQDSTTCYNVGAWRSCGIPAASAIYPAN